ncbi:hypothetical protein FOZ63_000367 [Perkinsus olseni]|uniref:Uncharacterized protein n=2 Tax=Perkinsus olseni TaxID=32597 RepID=A0A7J6SJC3_PEROL|nr:hypothetical protein FOZ60_013333 [Perkinsus olseni]KAF4732853.1 hypothetical protein FOZ63_000367 [Perkinsus olseni]
MLNFIPKTCQSVSFLYGKRAVQRIAVGAAGREVEVPLDVVRDIPEMCDTSASYIGNKYQALPWNEFIRIKLDARNLMDANVKTALTDLDWYEKIRAVYATSQTATEMDVVSKMTEQMAGKGVKYPVAKQ